MSEQFFPREVAVDAMRTAIAMCRAMEEGDDYETAAVAWNAAPNKHAVLWALLTLPGHLARGIDEHLDVAEVLRLMALRGADW